MIKRRKNSGKIIFLDVKYKRKHNNNKMKACFAEVERMKIFLNFIIPPLELYDELYIDGAYYVSLFF